MSKSFGIIIILIISIVILIGLVRQIADALVSGNRLDAATDEVSTLQDTNRKLREKLDQAEKPSFIEEIARNKLNMAKSNETVVVIEPGLIDRFINSQKKVEIPKLPNWQAWLKLFFR